MKQRFARLTILAVCTALVGGLVGVSAASASKIDDKQAQATALQGEIDANGEQISMLAEQYDGARIRLDEARESIDRVVARLAVAKDNTRRIRAIVGQRAADLYMGAGAQSPFGWTDSADVNETGRRSTYAAAAADKDERLLDQLRASREDLSFAERKLEAARDKAQQEVDALDASRREIEDANAKQMQLLSQVEGEIATLIEQERARKAAEEKARSDARREQLRIDAAQARADAQRAARVVGSDRTDSPSVDIPDAPAPSAGAAAAVAYAKAQLGKPYRYAAVGPDEFDCSGLTMMAWAQAGVSMPHYSAAQGAMFPRVPDDQLSPGDLVIYYPDEHHVAIYVGDGMTIAATQTGDFVKLQPVFRSSYQYAVRP